MIKYIAFDFVGVLVTEKDIELTDNEDRLERLFGDNISDEDYLLKAEETIGNDLNIVNITKEVIDKLYLVKYKELFKSIKEKYNDVKIIIATNHVSFVKDFIKKSFDNNYLDDILISSEIHMIKPNISFYYYILNKYSINPSELLFLDDNIDNINGAKSIGINTIKVDPDSDILEEVIDFVKRSN